MWWCAVLICAAVAVQPSPTQYSVPVPSIQAFSPRGLRLAIPDESEIRSVSFFLGFSKATVGPGVTGNQKVSNEGGRWTYWNPDVVVNPAELINYKITVNRGGLNWTRGGTHFVDKVLSINDNSVVATADCDEDTQQQIASFPVFDDADEEKNLATNGAKQNSLKSSYSMFKTMDSRPITRSSTTTTSGTFYIKPSGDVEGGGYKTSSSYDSTRHDGDQWQHSKSDLSQSELDELKRLHGDDFFKLPAFSHLNFGDVHSSGGTASSYRKTSSYSTSSSSQSLPVLTTGTSYNQIGQTHIGQPAIGPTNIGQSHVAHSQISGQAPADVPLHRPGSSGYSSYSSYQASDSAPVPQHYDDQSLIHNTGYGTPQSSGYKTVSKYNKKETVTTTGGDVPSYPTGDNRRADTYDYSTPIRGAAPQPLSNIPTSGSAIRKSETYEYSSGPQSTVPHPQASIRTPYAGEIFRSTIRPSSPASCSSSDFLGRKVPSQVDVVALDRSVSELQCLAVLAESSLRSEVRVLRQENSDLTVRLRDLENQFRRFRDECKCY